MDRTLELTLTLDGSRSAFHPGESVSGTAQVRGPQSGWTADFIDLIMFWRTSGKGQRDEGVVALENLVATRGEILPACFERGFHFQLPDGPWSYSGRLIRIEWYLGVYAQGKAPGRVKGSLELPLIVHPSPERFAWSE